MTEPRRNLLKRIRNRVTSLPRRIRLAIAHSSVGNPALRPLHDWYVAKDHEREIRAVAAGQRRFERDHAGDSTSFYMLRRNVHRLEKGLIMRPRRASFGADYIRQTVELYERAAQIPNFDVSELRWADQVLSEYFSVVDSSVPNVESARQAFQSACVASSAPRTAVPFLRDLNARPVASEDFYKLCVKRRSVRWFQDRQVAREHIDCAIQSAVQAPSACNRQPFQFRVFDSPAEAQQICSIAIGTRGFFHQVPAVAVLVGRLRAYPLSRDRHAIYIDAALAAMSFMLALECEGLASCPINWPDQEPQESTIRDMLQLEDDERVIMFVGFGWPDPEGMVPFSAKKGMEEIRRWS
jgi:nitroreductase